MGWKENKRYANEKIKLGFYALALIIIYFLLIKLGFLINKALVIFYPLFILFGFEVKVNNALILKKSNNIYIFNCDCIGFYHFLALSSYLLLFKRKYIKYLPLVFLAFVIVNIMRLWVELSIFNKKDSLYFINWILLLTFLIIVEKKES